MHPLQEAAKRAAGKDPEQSKKDEKERADNEAATRYASIKHIWQLEPAERKFEEDTTSCMLGIEEFIKQNCETMAGQLYEEPDLQKALRLRSTALDGACY